MAEENTELATPSQRRMAIAAMVLGIVSLVIMIFPYSSVVAIATSILAIVFGNKGSKAQDEKYSNKAKAGKIMGIVALVIAVFVTVMYIAAIAVLAAAIEAIAEGCAAGGN